MRWASSTPSSDRPSQSAWAWRRSEAVERGTHIDEWPALWDEMTVVRRSVPGAAW